MNSDQQGIAILFFSRTADAEARAKAWSGQHALRRNRAIARHLIRHTRSSLATAGMPVFHIDERQQRGRSFGERLANAYADLFAMGYEAVIAVGNDSPGLQQVQWEQIRTRLNRGEAVLGPSLSGGAYLIGLCRSHFDRASLEALPWEAATLWPALVAHMCDRSAELLTLPALADLNDHADLSRWVLGCARSTLLARQLANLLQVQSALPAPAEQVRGEYPHHRISGRAPPLD